MTMSQHVLFWIAVILGLSAFIVVFQTVLTPFILGATIAYLLTPVTAALSRWKFSSGSAALTILALFFVFVLGVLGVMMPILYRELSGLAQEFPAYIDNILAFLQPYFAQVQTALSTGETQDLKTLFSEHIGSAMNIARAVLDGMNNGSQAVGTFMTTLIFTPIVAYFMMKEWNLIRNWVYDLFPRDHKKTMMELLKEIDSKISGFVRGQIMVALALAAFYGIGLSLAGLKYGFVIGVLAGLLSIIPMVGSIVGLVAGVAMAWFQTGEWSFMGLIAAIFIAGQIIEGNFLTPKLVGDSVGLHPLWVFFALLAGGAVMGILGMFLAIPVAAVTGVLIAFALKKYKNSDLYKETTKSKSKGKKAAPKKAKKKA